ncbi:hypothetical protein HDU76_004216 [Blyttiomyces sp. JEL0837]|nr:hypothetical protein HDU76_004216 [Blyttiomyces sp. JEL0837]
MAPPTSTVVPQYAYLTHTGLVIAEGPSNWSELTSTQEPPRTFVYSPDGQYLAQVFEKSVTIINARTLAKVVDIEVKSVIEAAFSPKGTYFCTWARLVKTDDNAEPHKNLSVWETATGKLIGGFSHKNQGGWLLNWIPDESRFARLVTGEVVFYNPQKLEEGVLNRIKVEGLKSFSLSPNKAGKQCVAVFIGEKGGKPASVQLYDIGNIGGGPLAQRNFFNADSVDLLWNIEGSGLLVWTHTEVDNTNQSYYGKSSVHFMTTAGTFDCRIELGDGPIHHLAWSPNSKEFIAVHGVMPSKATLFDHRAQPLYEFPPGPRNFVSYSPHGRFIAIGGFGNLAGDLDVWDRMNFKKLALIHAPNSSSCEWSPDGRYLMTSTLYKRLKVDNGIRFWHYSGALTYKVDVKEMHQVGWRFDDSIHWPKKAALSPPPTPLASVVEAPAKPKGVYRPPGARGRDAPFSLRDDASIRPSSSGVVVGSRPESANPATETKVGADPDKPLSKAALKNQKKRAKKKGEGDEDSVSNGSGAAGSSAPSPAIPAFIPTDSSAKLIEMEKKMKNLQKKLKGIADIKAKKAAGEKLELTQIQKMEGEAALAKEIEDLRQQMATL